MPRRFVGLIRGINVGKAKRISMADLRGLMGRLGYGACRTLLNSGNVVFSGRGGDEIAGRIERAIAGDLGVTARAIVLPAADFSTVIEGNRLPKAAHDPSRVHVTFVQDPAELKRLAILMKKSWAPESLTIGKRAAYLWCPEGLARSPLGTAVGRILGESGTMRNWATVKKIAALLESECRP